MGIMEAVREVILDEGIEKGIKIERAKGLKERLEEKKQIARNFKHKNVDINIIAEATGLSVQKIASL